MKTMTEQECRAFVMSGFIPTSNEDIANIQDCFNHQSVDFHISLLMDKETNEKAEKLMRECLLCNDNVDNLIARVEFIKKQLAKRDECPKEIEELRRKVNKLVAFLEDTEDVEKFRKYI